MLAATVAFSIDAMLQVPREIAASLSQGSPNQVQLGIATFVVGMGCGTLFAGPLSDTFGRHKLRSGAPFSLFWALSSARVPRALKRFWSPGPCKVSEPQAPAWLHLPSPATCFQAGKWQRSSAS